MKKITKTILIICLIMFCCSDVVYAISQTTLENSHKIDSVTGWGFSTQKHHMGTKNTTYSFSSQGVYAIYNTYVTQGCALWGNNLSAVYSSNSSTAMGYIYDI